MDFLEKVLPDSIFGHRMPWAHDDSAKPPKPIEKDPEAIIQDIPKKETDLPEHESISTENSNEPVAPLDPAKSIEDGLSKLKIEQFSKIEQKAAELHEKAIALNTKIKGIDELLGLIQEWSTAHPNEPVDCQNEDIRKATEALRHQGIRVPLPEKTLEAGQIGNVFTVLGNQRSLLADELKEHSSAFQECTTQRNTLLQHLMSIISELSRLKNKISTNFYSRHG
jgi:hypothetical protein